jgi:hypothetical protein
MMDTSNHLNFWLDGRALQSLFLYKTVCHILDNNLDTGCSGILTPLEKYP